METCTATQATEDLLQDYGKLVFHVIYGLTHHWQESEDLTQETFLQAFRGFDAARAASGSQFQAKAWLLRIAINTVRMQQRRQRAVRFFTFSELGPRDMNGGAEEASTSMYEEIQDVSDMETIIAERDVVQRCMEHLPETLRVPLLLSVVAGFSSHEIADILNLKGAAIRQRLARARKLFQRSYERESGERIHTKEMVLRSATRLSRLRSHQVHRPSTLAPA